MSGRQGWRQARRMRDEWQATPDILGDEQVMAAIRRSKEAWAAGSTDEFVDLDEITGCNHRGREA